MRWPGAGVGFARAFGAGEGRHLVTSVTLEHYLYTEPSAAFEVRLYRAYDYDWGVELELYGTLGNPRVSPVPTGNQNTTYVVYSATSELVLEPGLSYAVAAFEGTDGASEVALMFASSDESLPTPGWQFGQDLFGLDYWGMQFWMPDPQPGHLKFKLDVEPAGAQNSPPDLSAARPSLEVLWPPNGRLVPFQIEGVTDADGDEVVLSIDAILQDEPVARQKGAPDSAVTGPGAGLLRAERLGGGNGRVYTVLFTASDGKPGGSVHGVLQIAVPPRPGVPAIDDGPTAVYYDSTTGLGFYF